jgi:Flp pilus assembly protein TadD
MAGRTRKARSRAKVAAETVSQRGFTAALLLILAAVAVAYAPSLWVPYLFDDHSALEENPFLQHPWTFQWISRVPENSALIARPFLSWTFGVSALLFGHGVAADHGINLLVHLANVSLVAALVRRGLGYTSLEEALRTPVALAMALLWGVHPLNVQAVAYLIQRSESLATCLELLALYAWIRSDEPRASRRWTALACASLPAAAATKEHGWIAPLLPLLWAWIFLGRTPAQEIRSRRVFYAVGAGSWLLLAALTLTGGRLAHVNADPGIDAWSYFINQPRVLSHYVKLFAVPLGQSFDYDWKVATLSEAWPWLLLWTALFFASAYAVWRRRPVGFPAALIFLSLATSSSFVALPDLAFEHRFYLAGACAAVLVVAPVAMLTRRAPRALYAVAAGLALVLGVLTAQRCMLFQSELAVWSEALERNPDQRRALSNVGGILLKQGRAADALEYYRKVEALGVPARMQMRIYFQTGNALLDLGRTAESRVYFQKALEAVHGEPGPIYANLGHSYLRDGNLVDARRMFERAVSTLTQDSALYFDLAYACTQLGDIEAGRRAYEEGLRLGGRPQPALRQLMAVFRTDDLP